MGISDHDWARLGLAQATETTCRDAEVPENVPLVVPCSDGGADQIGCHVLPQSRSQRAPGLAVLDMALRLMPTDGGPGAGESTMPETNAPRSGDLRWEPIEAVIAEAEARLGTRLQSGSLVVKRRSISGVTDRRTWARIERRFPDRSPDQGWGTESTLMLGAVSRPAWFCGVSWYDRAADALWRVDEVELVTEPTLRRGGPLTVDPRLTEGWWSDFNASMNALACVTTLRTATPDTVPATEEHVAEVITRVFPGVPVRVRRWTAAHADLNWANVTGPRRAVLVDWEDWGLAPAGLDTASLWAASLAVPTLAERLVRERQADLTSPDGLLMRLFALAKIMTFPNEGDPLLAPARREAEALVVQVCGVR